VGIESDPEVEVLPDVIERQPTPASPQAAPEVRGSTVQRLAVTGSDAGGLLTRIGLALIVLGTAIVLGNRKQKRLLGS
jgi:hypothetical protein